MALPPIPTISPLPEPPIRGTDTGPVFSSKTATFIDALHDDFQPEINATVGAINNALPTIEAAADAASDAEAARDLSEDARDAAIVAQGLAEDARDAAIIAQGLAEGFADDAEAAAQAAEAALLPSQSGNSGKFLTTNGSTPSWADVPASGAVLIASSTGFQPWEFTSISSTYSELWMTWEHDVASGSSNYFEIDIQARTGGAWQGYNRIGSGVLSPGSAAKYRGALMLKDARENQGLITAYFDDDDTDLLINGNTYFGSGFWAAPGGISGIRVRRSGSTGGTSNHLVRLYGRV